MKPAGDPAAPASGNAGLAQRTPRTFHSVLWAALRLASFAAGGVLFVGGLVKLLDLGAFTEIVSAHGRAAALGLDGVTLGPLPPVLAIAEIGVGLAPFLAAGLSRAAGLPAASGDAGTATPTSASPPGRGRELRAAVLVGLAWLALGAYAVWMHAVPPPAPTGCGCGVFGWAGVADWDAIARRNLLVAGAVLILSGAAAVATGARPQRPGTSAPAVG